MTNKHHTVLYTGLTNNIYKRTYEHKNQVYPGFTSRYKCYKLVYYEEIPELGLARHRERQLKKYRKEWKHNLIRSMNPDWRDLYLDFLIE
jgi:putative endonuclease